MSSRPSGPPRPNVLLLIVDDLGMSGMQSASMPNVHSLARRGAFFHDAHAQMPNCAPSRVTLMLGLRPDTHRAYGLADHFRDTLPAATTLPQRFKQAGYLALSYGKVYHQLLDDEPSWSNERELRGIDQLNASRGGRRRGQRPWREWRYNQYHTAAAHALRARRRRADRAAGQRWAVNRGMPLFERGPDADPEGLLYTDYRTASRSVASLAKLASQSRPWFLATGFVRPHLPFNAPSAFFDAAAASSAAVRPCGSSGSAAECRPPKGASPAFAAHLRDGEGELRDFGARMATLRPGSSRAAALATAYSAAASFADAQVGRVLREGLDAHNLTASTLVALCGDHGFKLGHGGSWGKHTLLRADTRVPLVLAGPGVRAGVEVRVPVELLDIYPTLLRLAGLGPPRGDPRAQPRLEGRPLTPWLSGGGGGDSAPARRGTAFALSQWPSPRAEWPCMGYALRTANWSQVTWAPLARTHTRAGAAGRSARCGGAADLFSNAPGPGWREARNLLAQPQLAPRAAALRDMLRRILRRDPGDPRARGPRLAGAPRNGSLSVDRGISKGEV